MRKELLMKGKKEKNGNPSSRSVSLEETREITLWFSTALPDTREPA